MFAGFGRWGSAKEIAYKAGACNTRLTQLQNLCSSSGLDAIVLINGVDSQFSEGCRQAINYLLCGASGSGVNSTSVGDELGDVVLVIRANCVDLYCSATSWKSLSVLVAQWENLRVYSPTVTMAASDTESVEELKLLSFIRMMTSHETAVVGIPLADLAPDGSRGRDGASGAAAGGEAAPAKKSGRAKPAGMAVEAWPLVQGYALDGIGPGGFFTMRHRVEDITTALEETVYPVHDSHSLKVALAGARSKLRHHWNSTLVFLEPANDTERAELSEATIGQPLASYYNYGKASGAAFDGSAYEPRVLLGTRTDGMVDTACAGGSVEATVASQNTAIAHATIEGADPEEGIRCARTYFLAAPKWDSGSATKGGRGGGRGGGGEKVTAAQSSAGCLFAVYSRLVAAVGEAVPWSLARGADDSNEAVAAFVASKLAAAAQYDDAPRGAGVGGGDEGSNSDDGASGSGDSGSGGGGPCVPSVSRDQVHVSRAAVNCSRVVELQSWHQESAYTGLVYVRVAVSGLVHPESGEALGSVVFGQTYAVCYVSGQPELSSVVCVTEDFPVFHAAALPSRAKRAIEDAEDDLRGSLVPGGPAGPLGAVVDDNLTVDLAYDSCVASNESVVVRCYESGVLVFHPTLGPAIVSLESDVHAVQLFEATEDVCLLFVALRSEPSPALSSTPFYHYLQCMEASSAVVFVLPKTTGLWRAFYRKTLPKWKEFGEIYEVPVSGRADELPEDLRGTVARATLVADEASAFPGAPVLSGLKTFLKAVDVFDAYAAAGVKMDESSWEYLAVAQQLSGAASTGTPRRDAGGDVSSETAGGSESGESDERMVVTLLVGVPGAGKSVIASKVSTLSTSENKWFVIEQPISDGLSFKPEKVVAILTSVLERSAAKKSKRKQVRILMVVPGYTDVVEAVRLIECSPEVSCNFRLGAVTAIVNVHQLGIPASAPDAVWHPYVKEQARRGFCQNIILTHGDTAGREAAAAAAAFLSAANPTGSVMQALGPGVLTESMFDAILDTEAFSAEKQARARRLACPHWDSADYNARLARPYTLETLFLPFRPLLDRDAATEQLAQAVAAPVVAAAAAASQQVLRVKGVVYFDDGDYAEELSVTTDVASTDVHEDKPLPDNDADRLSVFLFAGANLNKEELVKVLLAGRPPIPEHEPLVTEETLSEDEIATLKKQCTSEPLPQGCFFDGRAYVTASGDRIFHHPLWPVYVEQYLDELNEDVKARNVEIDLMAALAADEVAEAHALAGKALAEVLV